MTTQIIQTTNHKWVVTSEDSGLTFPVHFFNFKFNGKKAVPIIFFNGGLIEADGDEWALSNFTESLDRFNVNLAQYLPTVNAALEKELNG